MGIVVVVGPGKFIVVADTTFPNAYNTIRSNILLFVIKTKYKCMHIPSLLYRGFKCVNKRWYGTRLSGAQQHVLEFPNSRRHLT